MDTSDGGATTADETAGQPAKTFTVRARMGDGSTRKIRVKLFDGTTEEETYDAIYDAKQASVHAPAKNRRESKSATSRRRLREAAKIPRRMPRRDFIRRRRGRRSAAKRPPNATYASKKLAQRGNVRPTSDSSQLSLEAALFPTVPILGRHHQRRSVNVIEVHRKRRLPHLHAAS